MSSGMPEHARQVVAAASRQHAEHGARDRAQRVGHRADRAVAAEHGDDLAGARGLHGQLASVLEVARVVAPHRQPVLAQRALGLRRQAARAPAARGGVDDQANRSSLHGHGASVVRALAATRRPPNSPRARALRGGGLRAIAPAAPDGGGDAQRGDHDEQAEQHGRRGADAAERQRRPARRCQSRPPAARSPARGSAGCRAARARIPADAGGISRPIARSANSWRPLGGAWPRRSTALLRSPARRSASASEASAMRRSCIRSCGRAAAIARWK